MTTSIKLPEGKKAFFASDMHLGIFPYDKNKEKEKIVVEWLDYIKNEVSDLFLLGDVFDFWYEYRKVVPRGFVRFLGKLAELSDNGTNIHYFTGNHDVWVFDYLSKEIGLIVYRRNHLFNINDKIFYIGHGDGLNPKDVGYNFLKFCFTSQLLQFLFSRLHPNFAFFIGHTWSKHSRLSKGISEKFLGEDKEHQILFAKNYLEYNKVDYFVFGHRHLAMDIKLTEQCRMINLGEWIKSDTYAVFDGSELKLKAFESE